MIDHSRAKQNIARFLSFLFVILLTATSGCSSGGSSSAGGGTNPDDTKIVKIKIVPGAAMLTGIGQKQTLQAKAFNAADEEVTVDFTWTSSHPDEIAINDSGEVTAHALGSAEIKAMADGVTSQSAVVLMSAPVADAVLVRDEQIVGDFVVVDETTPFGLGFQYFVTLRGIDPPAIGTILVGVGVGAAPLGGRVVAVEQSGQDLVVTLEMVSIPEMFDQLALNENLDLSQVPATISEAAAEFYDLAINPDGSLLFTLKPDAPAIGKPETVLPPSARSAPTSPVGLLHPFKCTFQHPGFIAPPGPPGSPRRTFLFSA